MEFHYLPEFLEEGINSTRYLSRTKNPGTLVVFIHGFSGVSLETWMSFPDMLRNEPYLSGSDLYFYGYDSLKGQVFDQSRELYAFLKRYCDRRKTIPYEKILLVAHSLGAVITRYALISAIGDGMSWAPQCRLLLFAPAHSGTRVVKLVQDCLPGMLKIMAAAALYIIPVVDDLRPGSVALKTLERETLRYKKSSEGAMLSALVIQAYGDKVVHNHQFCYDRFLDVSPVRGYSHTTVCKPAKPYYMLPIQELINVLMHGF